MCAFWARSTGNCSNKESSFGCANCEAADQLRRLLQGSRSDRVLFPRLDCSPSWLFFWTTVTGITDWLHSIQLDNDIFGSESSSYKNVYEIHLAKIAKISDVAVQLHNIPNALYWFHTLILSRTHKNVPIGEAKLRGWFGQLSVHYSEADLKCRCENGVQIWQRLQLW